MFKHILVPTDGSPLAYRAACAAVDFAREGGVPYDAVLDAPASAYDGIVAVAKARGCDLVFMASHGRTGGPVEILGSVAQKVVALSPIPVLVYRTR